MCESKRLRKDEETETLAVNPCRMNAPKRDEISARRRSGGARLPRRRREWGISKPNSTLTFLAIGC